MDRQTTPKRSMTHLRSAFAAALCALVLSEAGAAWADTVLLRNGRKLEGIVVSQEADGQVVLEVGVGRLIFEPSQVAYIERSDSQDQERLRDMWSQRILQQENQFQLGPIENRLRSSQESQLLNASKSS